MAKSKYLVDIVSYGIYTKWDGKSKQLPKIQTFTTDVPAEIDVEFGFTVNIKRGKGKVLQYCIYHPNITDAQGEIMAPFEGDVHIRNNDWDFYLGDTIWAPIENKLGDWRMTMEIDGILIAEKTFNLYSAGESQFWKRRGY
ncbi:DUF3859 domain-containing protein [Thaumasiovibrio subtropicus]|uniref:DUF3859 domain-containing protein n=1 Tax=Thaumasiovibrio subtropicus TaxID=1891207 RepID=UPI000B35AF56|nr:DUF3859 domain-containing protein [Thaumasiovibrio subtropicus]